MSYAPLQETEPPTPHTAHITARRDGLAKVLDVGEVRGVPLPELLARGAAIFANRGQIARDDPVGTFAKSRPVAALDYFVSHSWSTARASKYAALLLHFNTTRAFATWGIVIYLAFLVEVFRFEELPSALVFDAPSQVDNSIIRYSAFSTAVGFLTLVLVHLFGHLFGSVPYLFLDIASIQQDDADRKAAGIQQLGAVLDRTDEMICLIDEHYWTRLWCVFELAAFYRRCGPERMILIPLHLTDLRFFNIVALVILLTSCYLSVAIHSYCHANGMAVLYFLQCSTGVLFTSIQLWFVVRGLRSQRALEGLRHFRLADAQCFDADDREALLDLIGDWFADRTSGETDQARLRQVGWHRFENIVRHDIPRHVAKDYGFGVTGTVRALAPLWIMFVFPYMYGAISSPGCTLGAAFFVFVTAVTQLPLVAVAGAGLHFGASLTDRLPAAVESPAARCSVLAAGVLVYYSSGVMAIVLDVVLPLPHLAFDPEVGADWRVPDDAVDPSVRRAFKASFICFINALVALFALGSLGK